MLCSCLAYHNTKKSCTSKSFKLDKSNAVSVGTTTIKPYLSICTVGLVWLARYCGKMYCHCLFSYIGLASQLVNLSGLSQLTKQRSPENLKCTDNDFMYCSSQHWALKTSQPNIWFHFLSCAYETLYSMPKASSDLKFTLLYCTPQVLFSLIVQWERIF